MKRLNERAWTLLDGCEKDDLYFTHLDCGSQVLDLGVKQPGGIRAGLWMARAVTAGLAEISLVQAQLAGKPWPFVQISTDQPRLACFLSQSANWPVDLGKLRGMGSGPACFLALKEQFAGEEECVDDSGYAVLGLETGGLPDDEGCLKLAAACGVPAAQLRVLVAPTASLTGSIQIAARSVETGLHKLHHLGFDLRKVRIATGLCPIAPPTSSDWQSIGLTNDFMMSGAQVWLSVGECEDQELADLAQRVPSSASEDYGKRFLEILEEKDGFYNVDPGIFAPAEITLSNLSNGQCYHGGQRDDARLEALLVGG